MTSLSLFVLLVLDVATMVCSTPVDPRGELIFSHVLYRHGDRTPSGPYPTDPYNSLSDWPVNWGDLTVRGMQMHFALGKWLRQRYGSVLLSEHYTPNEIYIRSDDYDRTIKSAESNLAGLYPPLGDQIWNGDLAWQPIPVHVVQADEDWILASDVPSCPVYENATQSLDTTLEFQQLSNDTKPFLDYILQYSGYTAKNILTGLHRVASLRTNLFIQDLYNKTLPEWTKAVYPGEEIDRLSVMYYNIPSYTPLLAKIRNGFLIKDILDRSTLKNAGTLSPDISVYVYSSHETILASLMYALGIPNNALIQYAACMLFELRSTPTGPKIEIFYKESYDTDVATPVYIPHCGLSCPLEKLYQLYNDIIPTEDFATICEL